MTGELSDDREFKELKKGVKNLLGFNTFQYKDTYLGRRFNSRLRAYHIDNYHAYWEILKNDKLEQERLLRDLTINVTEFFRDNPVYEVFKDEILPDTIKKKQGKIRIWSAGSSDGKEAYSIAMIAINALGEQQALKKIEIIGTDIDKDCLQSANTGIYESRPGVIQTDVQKQLNFIKHPEYYFDINGNIYAVKSCLKQLVSFQYHDLISGPKKKNFDIIFCRNVVIYFNRELQNTLFKDFFDALNMGGYFIMGKTETLVGISKVLFLDYNPKERIYRK